MRASDILTLYDHYYWANARILSAAANLSAEQFAAPVPFHSHSLRGTLVHTLAAERRWRSGWQGAGRPAPLREEDIATVEELRDRWREDEAALRAYLATLRDDDLPRDFALGERGALPLWHSLVQVVNHGTQHRSEAALILTHYGHSPGNLDFLFFALERVQPPAQ